MRADNERPDKAGRQDEPVVGIIVRAVGCDERVPSRGGGRAAKATRGCLGGFREVHDLRCRRRRRGTRNGPTSIDIPNTSTSTHASRPPPILWPCPHHPPRRIPGTTDSSDVPSRRVSHVQYGLLESAEQRWVFELEKTSGADDVAASRSSSSDSRCCSCPAMSCGCGCGGFCGYRCDWLSSVRSRWAGVCERRSSAAAGVRISCWHDSHAREPAKPRLVMNTSEKGPGSG